MPREAWPIVRTSTVRATVRGADWRAGTVHGIVHGETGDVKALRRHLLDERGLDRDRLSISGYWRRGADEDTFQAEQVR